MRIVVLICISIVTLSACKAHDSAAEQEQGGDKSHASTSAKRVDDDPERQFWGLEREDRQALVTKTLVTLKRDDLAQTWAMQDRVGNTPLFGWFRFGEDGPDYLLDTADAIQTEIETSTLRGLPVELANIEDIAHYRHINLDRVDIASPVERLSATGGMLGLDYIGTGTLTRRTDEGKPAYDLHVIIVDPDAATIVFETTTTVEE